ncbi:hypothetical protein GB931_22030 [Modestobacter sp. I12A-02628]|nr:hypothetical protein [Goekera deserti]NDI50490.1 hypothetical protein [Goekera deserti]
MTPKTTASTTSAFFLQAVIAFAVSSIGLLVGVAWLPLDLWQRSFLGMGKDPPAPHASQAQRGPLQRGRDHLGVHPGHGDPRPAGGQLGDQPHRRGPGAGDAGRLRPLHPRQALTPAPGALQQAGWRRR